MPTFIGQPVTVQQAAEGPEPARFHWKDHMYEVSEVVQAWSDWHFGEGSHRRSWRNRRHRNYYRVRTPEGLFELYADRGIRGEIQEWILVQQLEDARSS